MGQPITEKTTIRVDLKTLIFLVCLVASLVAFWADRMYHHHDERYMPREVLEQRLKALKAVAEETKQLLRELQHDREPR